eukprot:1347061-Pyramimonas_sp.AAC.1
MIAGYRRQRCSRFPEAFALVRRGARSGTQDLSISGPLATPVYIHQRGGFNNRRGGFNDRR